MTDSFNCKLRVVNFVHGVKDLKGGQCSADKNTQGDNSSKEFELLGWKGAFVCEVS